MSGLLPKLRTKVCCRQLAKAAFCISYAYWYKRGFAGQVQAMQRIDSVR